MIKKTFSLQTIVIPIIVTAVAFIVLGFQYVQATIQKAVAQGEDLRVSEKDPCAPAEDGERPNFSGCNSML